MVESPADFERVASWLTGLQQSLCQLLETEDGKARFAEDRWQSQIGEGWGNSRVLSEGGLWERAGVNYSCVTGDSLPPPATTARPELTDAPFSVCGLSLVIHPQNPYVPITHANLRCFFVRPPGQDPVWWFGGGYDLTPIYGDEEDCRHWHRTARQACLPFGEEIYPQLKRNCDEYFFLPHRAEPRGIGGLFFDDWKQGGFERSFEFVRSIGESWPEAYLPIVRRRCKVPYGQRERDFQLYRRGRYVEFNLLFDRGTKFGIVSNGRTESILMSLPPLVSWRYNWQPPPHSPEAGLYQNFLCRREWVDD